MLDGASLARSRCVELTPSGHVNAHQRLEDFAVVGYAQMEDLVRNDKILKRLILIG